MIRKKENWIESVINLDGPEGNEDALIGYVDIVAATKGEHKLFLNKDSADSMRLTISAIAHELTHSKQILDKRLGITKENIMKNFKIDEETFKSKIIVL